MAATGRVLVVEDEWFIADDYERVLRNAGYDVVGPAPNVDAAMRLIDEGGIDAGLLDISLGDQMSFPVAERLKSEGVPFVFLSGYSGGVVPDELKTVPMLGKPTLPRTLLDAVAGMMPE